MCNHHHHNPDRRALLAGISVAASSLWLGVSLRPAFADAALVDLPEPGPKDTCPVCGMFVYKYTDWVAILVFADGTTAYFDGSKDFFKFLTDVGKYAPGRSRDQIVAMGVTDYYTVQHIDPKAALYVIGSDVLGPMGHELVPLMNDADAGDFMKDHHGVRLLAYDDVTAPVLAALDQGKFE